MRKASKVRQLNACEIYFERTPLEEGTMTENQVSVKEWVKMNVRKYQELLPEVGAACENLTSKVYKDGALNCKTKRLMTLAVAFAHGCRGCILFQTEQALSLGASVEEILEACSVAIALGGSMAGGETARVLQLLSEAGSIGHSSDF
jgi:AhpD family alkylhydroperoxidase